MPMNGLSMRQAVRHRRRWRLTAEPGELLARRRVMKERVTRNAVMDSAYDARMAHGEVDREKWAEVVRDGLTENGGKKAPFARLIGVDVSTLNNWLKCSVSVSEASVRQYAAATNQPLVALKMRVGIYGVDDFPTPMATAIPALPSEIVDAEQRRVLGLDVDDATKVELLKQIGEWRAADERRIEALREHDAAIRGERLDYLIERMRKSD